MASKPSMPETPVAATRPERVVDVAPEDVKLGGTDPKSGAEGGKRQLTRPKSASAGLQV